MDLMPFLMKKMPKGAKAPKKMMDNRVKEEAAEAKIKPNPFKKGK